MTPEEIKAAVDAEVAARGNHIKKLMAECYPDGTQMLTVDDFAAHLAGFRERFDFSTDSQFGDFAELTYKLAVALVKQRTTLVDQWAAKAKEAAK